MQNNRLLLESFELAAIRSVRLIPAIILLSIIDEDDISINDFGGRNVEYIVDYRIQQSNQGSLVMVLTESILWKSLPLLLYLVVKLWLLMG